MHGSTVTFPQVLLQLSFDFGSLVFVVVGVA